MPSTNTRENTPDLRFRAAFVAFSLLTTVAACAAAPADPLGDAGSGGALPSRGGMSGSAGSAGSTAAGTAGSSSSSGTGGTGPTTGGTGPNGGGSGSGAGTTSSGGSAGSGAGSVGGAGESTGGTGSNLGGSGGAVSAGGAGGTGASGASTRGPELTDVSTFTPATCTITPSVTPASKIPMVGVATFSADLPGATGAIIQFGETSEYTLEAPVNWQAAEHRTLLLGMPADTDVHYRVVVFQGNSACIGSDATYRTGEMSGAPNDQTPTKGSSTVAPAPGFIIAEAGAFSYIVNKQGKVVWAYRFPMNLTRSLLSWDGQYMLARELGPFNSAMGGTLYRVGMDGEGELELNVSGGNHHDFTVTPRGIAYPGKQAVDECDSLYTANVDGSESAPLVDLDIVFGKFEPGPGSNTRERCHVNAIRYYLETDSYSLSDREKDAIAFISSTGEVLGSIGATPIATTPNHVKAAGADSTSDSDWRVQHGHELYAPNKLVLWSNGSFMAGESKLLHYTITGSTATLDWEYTGTGTSPTLSDAQHLPNGNFLGTNSQTGAVHEIDPAQKLVQSFPSLCKGGYSHHRPTLYGPPPGR